MGRLSKASYVIIMQGGQDAGRNHVMYRALDTVTMKMVKFKQEPFPVRGEYCMSRIHRVYSLSHLTLAHPASKTNKTPVFVSEMARLRAGTA